MGWRDINMNRRKPPMRLAVVPVEEGQDERQAVLGKACRAALAQLDGAPATVQRLAPFLAGYIAGFARHQALRHGVDAETVMAALLRSLQAEAPPPIGQEVAGLRFSPRAAPLRSARAGLGAENGMADAGYLAGHLASLCRSEGLLASALRLLSQGDVEGFLTACDTAADRMQTHQPTMSLRFDEQERAVLRRALA